LATTLFFPKKKKFFLKNFRSQKKLLLEGNLQNLVNAKLENARPLKKKKKDFLIFTHFNIYTLILFFKIDVKN